MDAREARRRARRELASQAHRLAAEPGVIGDPDDRARMIEAYVWAAEFLAPGESSSLPANLRPLVRPDGTPLPEWSTDRDLDAPIVGSIREPERHSSPHPLVSDVM